jgi:tRNA(adenine34) deaminase
MKHSMLVFAIVFAIHDAGAQKIDSLLLKRLQADTSVLSRPDVEKDLIFSLAAYSVVYKDWQTTKDYPARGYNIGSVLTQRDTIRYWARNCVSHSRNATQHGEVRLMTGFLRHRGGDPKASTTLDTSFSIYTTLEPCAQCAGMMKMTAIGRTVYGQKDTGYSYSLDRLNDSSLIQPTPSHPMLCAKGFRSHVMADSLPTLHKKYLDDLYKSWATEQAKSHLSTSITTFLALDTVKTVYSTYDYQFKHYKARFAGNKKLYEIALKFLAENAGPSDTPDRMDHEIRCEYLPVP